MPSALREMACMARPPRLSALLISLALQVEPYVPTVTQTIGPSSRIPHSLRGRTLILTLTSAQVVWLFGLSQKSIDTK